MSVSATPQTSHHADLRFVQRGTVLGSTARRAWIDGTAVSVEGYDYHHARYDDSLGVILLARDGEITTVLNAGYVEFTEVKR